jgi:H+/Cl- antiporter ClcA
MAAILGGTMRAPLTSVVFAFGLTHDLNALLPTILGCAIAYGFTVIVMPQSILTEKIARTGFMGKTFTASGSSDLAGRIDRLE